MALITTHHLSDTSQCTIQYTYVATLGRLLKLCMYITTTIYIIITNFTTVVAVYAVTWSAILRQFTKNYQDTTPKCRHYASIAGRSVML